MTSQHEKTDYTPALVISTALLLVVGWGFYVRHFNKANIKSRPKHAIVLCHKQQSIPLCSFSTNRDRGDKNNGSTKFSLTEYLIMKLAPGIGQDITNMCQLQVPDCDLIEPTSGMSSLPYLPKFNSTAKRAKDITDSLPPISKFNNEVKHAAGEES